MISGKPEDTEVMGSSPGLIRTSAALQALVSKTTFYVRICACLILSLLLIYVLVSYVTVCILLVMKCNMSVKCPCFVFCGHKSSFMDNSLASPGGVKVNCVIYEFLISDINQTLALFNSFSLNSIPNFYLKKLYWHQGFKNNVECLEEKKKYE